MTDMAHGQAALAPPLHSRRVLIERVRAASVEASVGSPVTWVESLRSHLTPVEACIVVEHVFGILPLVTTLFEDRGGEMAAARSGATLGALGLFTPGPEHRWGAVAMAGEPGGGAWRLHGEARLSSPAADGSIVLVRVDEVELRLAWLNHHTRGVERRGSRTGGPLRDNSPCWLVVNGATIPAALVSRPVTLMPGDELHRSLVVYASVWALVAVDCARCGVSALRRALRTTRAAGQSVAFSASQAIAMDITEAEIETELTLGAAHHHLASATSPSAATGGLALALSAARTLTAVAASAIDLRDQLGLAPDTPLTDDGAAAALIARVGGTLTLENELARARGLGEASAA